MTSPWVSPPASSPPHRSRHWQGQLTLEFAQRADKTILSRSQVQAPLKVQRPFYPEGEAICHSVMLHTAGGMVGGDQLQIQATVQAQAQALITNAAATKVYRSNGLEAQNQVKLHVARGGCLEWLPQETILFNGAQYRQSLQVTLEADALWLGWDLTRLGRSARGERFDQGEWHSQTEVWQAGRLIWVDPQWVAGGSEMIQSRHGLNHCPVIASFACIGREFSKTALADFRSQLAPIEAADQLSLTRLQSGLLCRYRGHSMGVARSRLIQLWQILRTQYWGRSGCIPRVWQI
ncbi:MAG: urease accessory protein UreD [Elainella sp. Prado103]|jgi:urease accessory protein|nr:urease accessory protein UreD [Elainella sp. Prado103]